MLLLLLLYFFSRFVSLRGGLLCMPVFVHDFEFFLVWSFFVLFRCCLSVCTMRFTMCARMYLWHTCTIVHQYNCKSIKSPFCKQYVKNSRNGFDAMVFVYAIVKKFPSALSRTIDTMFWCVSVRFFNPHSLVATQ